MAPEEAKKHKEEREKKHDEESNHFHMVKKKLQDRDAALEKLQHAAVAQLITNAAVAKPDDLESLKATKLMKVEEELDEMDRQMAEKETKEDWLTWNGD
jgi:hypothetical protein